MSGNKTNVRLVYNYDTKSVKVLWDVEVLSGFLPFPGSGIVLSSPEECEDCDLLQRLSEDEQIGLQYFWLDVGKVNFESQH